MEAYLLDWVNLLLRWLHVITAIAWIGSSFYFVFLDNNLLKPKSPDLLEKGVDGAMWAVHGGGFYNPQKYMVAPKKIHTELHWFYWESYSTWLSGFALFTVLYLYNAGTFLIDKSLMDWSPAAAISAALGFLVAFWLIYDRICQWFGFREKGDAIVGALVFAVICVASWAACQLFAGRAAFLLVGAMIATAMSANVFFWIIPGQRKVVAAMTSGEKVDPKALESVPVPAAATTETSKSVANNDPATLGSGPNNFKTVQHVLEQRCYMCHGAQVQMKNVRLDTPEGVKTNAQMVYQQVVVLKQMPMNNATGLTEAERALIGEWFKAGAKTQ